MRLFSYAMKHDTGFVPNPFWGYCTCAGGAPNRSNMRVDEGDWLIGSSSSDKAANRRLIYAMRVAEVLDFDAYYRDERFKRKKARHGTWQDRCGDNIYYRNRAGDFVQRIPAFFHTSPEKKRQDTSHPHVFVSDHFFYFGENAIVVPARYAPLVRVGRGCKKHEGDLVDKFVHWLESTYDLGLHGLPRDRDEKGREDSESNKYILNVKRAAARRHATPISGTPSDGFQPRLRIG